MKTRFYVKVVSMSKCYNYAVVHWYNYRKELSAGFLKGFDDFEEAKKYAYSCAERDMYDYDNENARVITEDEITDNNGPGAGGGPYNTIIGYGGRNPDGYATTFYCVVTWFDGVENSWDFMDDSENEDYEWVPRYD